MRPCTAVAGSPPTVPATKRCCAMRGSGQTGSGRSRGCSGIGHHVGHTGVDRVLAQRWRHQWRQGCGRRRGARVAIHRGGIPSPHFAVLCLDGRDPGRVVAEGIIRGQMPTEPCLHRSPPGAPSRRMRSRRHLQQPWPGWRPPRPVRRYSSASVRTDGGSHRICGGTPPIVVGKRL